MLPKADLTYKEVTPPHNRWCASKHEAPKLFARMGPGTEKLPTQFYRVTSVKDPNVNGVYCEPCCILANYVAKQMKKKSNGDGVNVGY